MVARGVMVNFRQPIFLHAPFISANSRTTYPLATIEGNAAMIAPIYDLLLIMGLFVSASGCGIWILNIVRLRASSWMQHILLATGLGLGLLGYITFSLGMAALLRQRIIAGAYVLALLLGLLSWRHFLARNPLIWTRLLLRWRELPRMSQAVLLFLVMVAGINMIAALAPVIGVDELIYRLAAAKLYLMHERLLYIPSMVFHQQPQHIQMIQLWGLSLGSESTTQVVQCSMGFLLLLALITLARREMPITWSLLSGAILYTYSDVIVLSGRASPDLANGLWMVLAIIAWLHWVETGIERWMLVAGALAGLFAAGARLPGAYGAIGLVMLVIICSKYHHNLSLPKAMINGLTVGLLALLMVTPWYLRSYMQTGNPVWPFLGTVFGAQDWTTVTYQMFTTNFSEQEVGRWLSATRIFAAPWDLTMRPERFHSGMAGPVVLATLPIALLVRIPRRLKWILAACAVLGILWYVSYPRLRAFIPGIGLLSVISGYLLWQLWMADMLPRWARVAAISLACTWLIVGFGTTLRFHLRAAGVTIGLQTANEYLEHRLTEPDMKFYWFTDYQVLNRTLPSDSRLLIYDTRGYHLDFDYDHYTLIARRTPDPHNLQDPDYVERHVGALGTDYVLLWPEPQHTDGTTPANILEDTLHTLCDNRWPIIYASRTMIVCQIASHS